MFMGACSEEKKKQWKRGYITIRKAKQINLYDQKANATAAKVGDDGAWATKGCSKNSLADGLWEVT